MQASQRLLAKNNTAAAFNPDTSGLKAAAVGFKNLHIVYTTYLILSSFSA